MYEVARVKHNMMVPMLESDGTFTMIQVKAGSVFPILANDCGPMVMTTSHIILSKSNVVIEKRSSCQYWDCNF